MEVTARKRSGGDLQHFADPCEQVFSALAIDSLLVCREARLPHLPD
jgi:hypothetical protein